MSVELATAYVSIVPSFKGIEGKVDAAGDSAGKRFAGGFGRAAKAGMLAAGGAALGLGVLAKSAISEASDVNESQSKVGVVFGKSAAQIVAASNTSATAMGLSKSAYLDATGTLGNLLVSLKLAPKHAADMSQQMVKLAGDLASFNNVSPEEALAAIKSGLVGETEPLRAFGVNMNDATLRAQALKLHLIKSVKDGMTPQTKALAAQALIMDQTKTAQGDFTRTSGGLANQQRILAAQFQDVKAKIGTALLPVAVKLAHVFTSKVLPAFTAIWAAAKSHWPQIRAVAMAVFVPIKNVVMAVVGWVVDHWPQISAVIVAVWKAAQVALHATVDFIRTKVIPAVQAVVGWVVAHWPQIKTVFAAVWNFIKPIFAAFGNLLKTVWTSVLMPLVGWIQSHWPQIKTVMMVVFAAIGVAVVIAKGILIAAFKVISTAITVMSAVFRWEWNNVISPVYSGIKTGIGVVRDVVGAVSKAISTAFRASSNGLKWAWDHVVKPTYDGIKTGIQAVSDFIGPVIAGMYDIFRGIGDGLKWAWDHTLGPVFTAIKTALQWIKDTYDAVFGSGSKAGTYGDRLPGPKSAKPGQVAPPHRAMGGPVVKGHPYVVGDGGRPELFVPNESGRIIPRVPAMGNGSKTVNVTQNNYYGNGGATPSSPDQLRRAGAAFH